MGPGSVEKTRVIPEKSTWLDTTWSSHFLNSYCMFRMMITGPHLTCLKFLWQHSRMIVVGQFFSVAAEHRSKPGRQRASGVPMRVWFFHGHRGDRLWCWDQRAGGSPFFRPQKKGWNMFGHPESLWNCAVNSNIYTFFFVTFFHLLLALGVKNRWVFKISVPTFFCCWTLHLLIVSDTSCGKNHPFPKSYTNSPQKKEELQC